MEVLNLAQISPDQVVVWQAGPVVIPVTLLYTWLVMFLLVAGSLLATRNLASSGPVSRRQLLLEAILAGLRQSVRDLGGEAATVCLPFVGTLFLFILLSNLLAVVPGFVPPTASLATTAALALAVFAAVPLYGIRRRAPARALQRPVRGNRRAARCGQSARAGRP